MESVCTSPSAFSRCIFCFCLFALFAFREGVQSFYGFLSKGVRSSNLAIAILAIFSPLLLPILIFFSLVIGGFILYIAIAFDREDPPFS